LSEVVRSKLTAQTLGAMDVIVHSVFDKSRVRGAREFNLNLISQISGWLESAAHIASHEFE
jgi:hypothetical protein